MRRRLGLYPRFLGRLVASKHFLDKGIGADCPVHLNRLALADAIFEQGARAAVKEIDDDVRRKCILTGKRRAKQLAHAEIAIELLAIAVELTIEHDAHLP